MRLFRTMDISASGLTAQSMRMDIIAQNIANAQTTRTADGGPYQRRIAILASRQPSFSDTIRQIEETSGASAGIDGVMVARTIADDSPFKLVHDPEHPDADEDGYVRMPNVDIAREYVDMISATRSYEANITVLNASKRMALKALEIGR